MFRSLMCRHGPIDGRVLVLCFMLSSACGVLRPAPIPASVTPFSPTPVIPPVTEAFTPFSTTPTASSTITPAPLNLSPQVSVLAENLPEPDDLILAPDGSIY